MQQEIQNIAEEFFQRSKIPYNIETCTVMNFLCSPDAINRMIVASEMGLPALGSVIAELETLAEDFIYFSFSDSSNRRKIGWMVKYVMKNFGYCPEPNNDRTRIGSKSKSKFFSTASVYSKTDDTPRYEIKTIISKKEE